MAPRNDLEYNLIKVRSWVELRLQPPNGSVAHSSKSDKS